MSQKENEKDLRDPSLSLDIDGDGNLENIYSTPSSSFIRKLELSTVEKASKEEIESMKKKHFFGHCRRILQNLITDHDNDIKDVLLDLFLKHQIRNEQGLSLLQLDELPTKNSHSLWGVSTFKKCFKMMKAVSKTHKFTIITDFDEI